MSVARHLKNLDWILKKIQERPDCSEITHYTPESIEYFRQTLQRVIVRYARESERVKRHQLRQRHPGRLDR